MVLKHALVFTFFTGFCWNFSTFVNPVIYAATFTKPPIDLVSVPISGQSPLRLTDQLNSAQTALPNALPRLIALPEKPEEATWIGFNLLQGGEGDVFIDPFSGKVLRASTSDTLFLGDRILSAFNDLHYGTFWGLPTRILYVFVGLAPTMLLITGFVMWHYRRRGKKTVFGAMPQPIMAKR